MQSRTHESIRQIGRRPDLANHASAQQRCTFCYFLAYSRAMVTVRFKARPSGWVLS